MRPRPNRELWLALAAVLVITALYLLVMNRQDGVPPAGNFYGHSLGVLGFVLMLMTETLYSLRKRSRRARWGRPSEWLSFHIFTGIVGPYLVLLHSSWKFNGLAGGTLLLTVLIVLSGFTGRYLYTAIPRSADGIALERDQIQAEIDALQAELSTLLQARPELSRLVGLAPAAAGFPLPGGALPASPPRRTWLRRLSWWWAGQRGGPALRAHLARLQTLLDRQESLRRGIASLALARRLLALWHTVHIPLGMALFTAAFLHILAALYYATFLR